MKFVLAVVLALFASVARPPLQPERIDQLLHQARAELARSASHSASPRGLTEQGSPADLAEPVATATPECPLPPPWTDRATAERCWSRYAPPYGRVIVPECQLGYSALGDLICFGYYVPTVPPAGACVIDWSLPVTSDNERLIRNCYDTTGAPSYVLCPPLGPWEAIFDTPYCHTLNHETPAP